MTTFVRRFVQAFVTCWFFLAISSPFASASLHALTIATPVALIGAGFAYGQRVLSCNCDVDVIHGRFSENCSVHGKHRDNWYLTQGDEWRVREDPHDDPIYRILNRYAEDFVNGKGPGHTAERLEARCDAAIKLHLKGREWNTGVAGLGKKIDDTPDYLALKQAGRPESSESPFRNPPMEVILKV